MADNGKKPLSGISSGQTVIFSNVDAGCELRSRLAAMGLVPNARLKVVSNGGFGPFVINVRGSKVVLGRGVAHKVMVEEACK
ncbi:FeoA domain protein [Anaerohalosphaera lusitana]|uniref:FeoA domain protein n=1 Tax=Anaerohalosphaera lusitana TaxID=1936003 RepID=A0A1U9NNJ6_9BACT|nr:ferrous iron transport protein A [Anaerohalosphaera lusitana]AQT69367.1 FeoA domain protein [Anaerohalosphaera lusitana]